MIDKLLGIVEENGLDCCDLILEITESAYTDDAELIVETAKKLREHGFCIEMDDFGTGYSSLNMLASLPIDVLKLEAIISLAKALEVPCIAEGVETAEQVDALKKMGCNIIQGYFFSRPLPELEFEHFVMEHKTLPEAAEQ